MSRCVSRSSLKADVLAFSHADTRTSISIPSVTTDRCLRCHVAFDPTATVAVDGAVVNSNAIVLSQGSTIATLKSSFLEQLSVGTHTIRIVFADTSCAQNTFTVVAPAGDTDKDGLARTGDTVLPVAICLLASLAAFLGAWRVRRHIKA